MYGFVFPQNQKVNFDQSVPGTSNLVNQVPDLVRLSTLGQVFVMGMSQTITALLTNVRFLMQNPSNSGITMTLFKLITYSTQNGTVAVSVDPSTAPNTEITNVMSSNITQPVTRKGKIFSDASGTAISGGVANHGISAYPIGNAQYVSELTTAGIIIPAGHSLGMNFTPGTPGQTPTITVVLTWLEA